MKNALSVLVTLGLLGLPSSLHAQSLSAADIASMVDERMGGVDEYAAVLDDPDPERSLAAMQIMIGINDAQISRMALQHGLTSTNSAVRRAALQAYLDSSPNLEFYFDGSALDLGGFTGVMPSTNGTVSSEAVGYIIRKVGDFDQTKGCYVYANNANYCLASLSEEAVTISLWQRASPFKLNSEGLLVGEVFIDRMTPAAPTTIPVRP